MWPRDELNVINMMVASYKFPYTLVRMNYGVKEANRCFQNQRLHCAQQSCHVKLSGHAVVSAYMWISKYKEISVEGIAELVEMHIIDGTGVSS